MDFELSAPFGPDQQTAATLCTEGLAAAGPMEPTCVCADGSGSGPCPVWIWIGGLLREKSLVSALTFYFILFYFYL